MAASHHSPGLLRVWHNETFHTECCQTANIGRTINTLTISILGLLTALGTSHAK